MASAQARVPISLILNDFIMMVKKELFKTLAFNCRLFQSQKHGKHDNRDSFRSSRRNVNNEGAGS
jgi:hypothetical protein